MTTSDDDHDVAIGRKSKWKRRKKKKEERRSQIDKDEMERRRNIEEEIEDEDIVDTNNKDPKETNPHIIDYNQLGMITGGLAVIATGLVIYKMVRGAK